MSELREVTVYSAWVDGKHGHVPLGVFGTSDEAQSAIDSYDSSYYMSGINEETVTVNIEAIEASGRVVIDRARFERLLAVAKAWVDEGSLNGEGWDLAFIRANLQPGDLEPLP